MSEREASPEWQTAARLLQEHDMRFYPRSIRQVGEVSIAFAKYQGQGFIVSLHPLQVEALGSVIKLGEMYLYPVDWYNYLALRELLHLSPSPCERSPSFGTGDRLGMVSAAHLRALSRYELFPVIAQQSPRELVRTGRDFREVLLDAVCGVLEEGYLGSFGADADHIQHEQQLLQAIEAGYTLFTIDLSDRLRDTSQLTPPEVADKARALSPLSQSIIRQGANLSVRAGDYLRYNLSEARMVQSAITFEEALEHVVHLHEILQRHLPDHNLEVSIDESSRVTTLEDHFYVVEYLRRRGVELWSLAPRFPGEFQKGVDYEGDLTELERAFRLHAALCRQLQGYRLSLHSGSDKFRIYSLWREATEGQFHVKTSGTSWLQAVQLVSRTDPALFNQMYQLSLSHLEHSKRAYRVSLRAEQLPPVPPADLEAFLSQPSVRQLFHISYGVLLDEYGSAIRQLLEAHEQEHYRLVAENIERHLQALVG
ncbi:MAG: tagaturonate epimerase family protein [Armatimonadetes bacterium]|nr:tagaturonate epimerase family protein [Armatimonadota bacterium]